jgi:hypothetical protein
MASRRFEILFYFLLLACMCGQSSVEMWPSHRSPSLSMECHFFECVRVLLFARYNGHGTDGHV